ncbi:MAG: DivIVA domain-containing protein [Bacilli bacterium]
MEKFNRELNGYNKEEVNRFLSETITQLEAMLSKATEQDKTIKLNQITIGNYEKEIASLTDKINHFQTMEDTIKRTILVAEETSNNIRTNSIKEANLIVEEARNNANRIVNDSLVRAEKIELQSDNLERNMRIFKKKLKSIIEQQMVVVDEIEEIELK